MNLEVCSKWYFMSVASTSWTMVLRNSLNWSLERRVKKLHSSVSKMAQAEATCILSSTDWSL